MRKLLHLSDLHFGRVDESVLGPLIAFAHRLRPHCVVVSGDLTQRARPHEFAAARRFLDALPRPQIVVPGNHDVPLYDVVARFVRPLAGFREHIGENVEPSFVDEEIAVFGLNSARSLTFKGGRINRRQLQALRERCATLPAGVVKVVVSHHPIDAHRAHHRDELVGRASLAMRAFDELGVDVLLAGHLHLASAASSAARVELEHYAALLVQAGTATSTRGRGEANSFNVLRLSRKRITVQCYAWRPDERAFGLASTARFARNAAGWSEAPPQATSNDAR